MGTTGQTLSESVSKELLREFEIESGAGTHPEAEGFLARLKEFWNGCDKA